MKVPKVWMERTVDLVVSRLAEKIAQAQPGEVEQLQALMREHLAPKWSEEEIVEIWTRAYNLSRDQLT